VRLDEYIEKSLIDISKGVTAAQKKANVTIAPGAIEGKPVFEPQMVKFEVEVTTSLDGGGKINVLSLADLNIGGERMKSHKLTFEVPVHFNSENVYMKGNRK